MLLDELPCLLLSSSRNFILSPEKVSGRETLEGFRSASHASKAQQRRPRIPTRAATGRILGDLNKISALRAVASPRRSAPGTPVVLVTRTPVPLKKLGQGSGCTSTGTQNVWRNFFTLKLQVKRCWEETTKGKLKY